MAALPGTDSITERLSSLALRFSGMEGIGVSFEFFPPRTEEMEKTLWRSILRLAPLAPRFVSVTYGAGGSTRHRTHATVRRILGEPALTPAAHLTCVGASRGGGWTRWRAPTTRRASGHIVALRGDPPEAGERYTPHPGGYAHAVDLVAGLRRIADFRPLGRGLPRDPPGRPESGVRGRLPQTQARRGGEPRHHPVLLRHGALSPLPGIGSAGPESTPR